jgi:hypothetical protein
MKQHRTAISSVVVLACAVAVPADAGVKVGDDTTFLNLGLLLQSRFDVTQKGAPDKDAPDLDFYLRRTRILLSGQLNQLINFFVETDNPNLGSHGDLSARMFIQDAFLELNFDPKLQVDMGMLLLPFSHMGMEAATALHSVDYHSALIRYPTGSHLVFRDFGVMVRGLVAQNRVEYRLGVFNGVRGDLTPKAVAGGYEEPTDPRNPHDQPRVAARLTLNAFDAEGGPTAAGFFYKGIYLKETDQGLISPKEFLSLGGSIDWQPKLNITFADVPAAAGALRGVASRKDYLAWDVDVFIDMPVAREGLVGVAGQVDFYHYDYGSENPNRFYPGGVVAYTGYGLSSELGLRYDRYEIIASVDWFNADGIVSTEGDYLDYRGTLVYYLKALATNFKVESGARRTGTLLGHGDWIHYGLFQAQLVF